MRFTVRSLLAIATLLIATAAQATVIFTDTRTLSNSDLTQLGRPSRNAVAQTWTNDELFPGAVNTSTSYHYQTITLDLDSLMAGMTFGSYLQISVDYGEGTSEFVSAYLDAYSPLNTAAGWLGDTGASGNAFGNAPYFQVMAGSGHDLVLLLNDTHGGAINASNVAVSFLVEAFMDTEYTDLSPAAVGNTVPEPASLALAVIAVAAMWWTRRRPGH